MSWLICGTVPNPEIGLIYGKVSVRLTAGKALRGDTPTQASGNGDSSCPAQDCDEACLLVSPAEVAGASGTAVSYPPLPIKRGTAALAGAAALAAAELGTEAPYILVAGDNGKGEGSRLVYEFLLKNAASFAGWGITFHYLLPDVDWHNRLLIALDELEPRPTLCADAGFMYAAKMSGYAASYDLFTPDAGELAFLADEQAPHPFYTRGFLLSEEDKAPEQAARAFEHENSARTMLIKGKTDLIVQDGKVLEGIDYPMIPNLEPIGGTGDTVAGTASALLSAGYPMLRACRLAALTNRFMGQLAQPTPATQISELLAQLPGGLRLALQET
ncbi:sugar kinase [Desulfovibrio sp. OttesenSCG-928-C06]|nr:sugar kinase [Desulfovibrio sp. OttesenSCG-928-C06]